MRMAKNLRRGSKELSDVTNCLKMTTFLIREGSYIIHVDRFSGILINKAYVYSKMVI